MKNKATDMRSLGWGLKSSLGAVILLVSGCATHLDHDRVVHSGKKSSLHGQRPLAAYNRPYRVNGYTYYPLKSARGYRERGIASWYGWESGDRTAMGTRFNPRALTAAHRTLPLPSRVKVTNLKNKRSIIVTVNDRGPFVRGRLIDLSYGAAKALRINGLAPVVVEAIN
ncbi:MAG: septal ring lytic transglycosylase RlpA family protein [Methylohalobius sp.]|nr:septal ring lytic transglycosylase RlpA family protein [Methylohalobius sp.]